ncbi:MAG: hypothetical protein QXU49_05765 [Candidatus Caldarchaeum sp.]|uniref:Uncharacterized protein n=1 Tax=Caldiarchaeum subterraneum TaxID=311458 RepID=A0A7C5L8T6_CALS0
MMLYLEVFDGTNWVDKTRKCTRLRRRISARSLESLEAELVETVGVGTRVRLRKNTSTLFEGVVYEARKTRREGDVARCEITAYTDLILYDRHVVFRSYPTGTRAGTIIKDLATLETGVNVTNVDEDTTPALNSQWDIQNEVVLKIMQNVARGTNYWLRMKPGKMVFFKPKTVGAAAATIDDTKIISSEYSEDRWKLKNRVIYVGAGGQVLADVSEGAGDLPVVVHDPFLTDANEALRRANIRLELNKEYGKQLTVETTQTDFEALNVDLGDTVKVNLPSLGLNNVNMFLLEIEYDPHELRYRLTFGGRLEMFEEFFEEAVGGDVAAKFGQSPSITEEKVASTSILIDALKAASKIQAKARTVRIVNSPPLVYDSGSNIVLDDSGYVVLASGFTNGVFEWGFTPESETFTKWLRVIYDFDAGEGSVKANLLRGDNTTIKSEVDRLYEIEYLPHVTGSATEGNASEWKADGGVLTDSAMGLVNRHSINVVKTGAYVEAYYPSGRNLGWDISSQKYFVVYLYSLSPGSVEVRLYTDANNYRKASLSLAGGVWQRFEVTISTMTSVGSPTNTVDWIGFVSTLPKFNIDSDHFFYPVKREKIKLRFMLSRPSASALTPKIKYAKLVWRESG